MGVVRLVASRLAEAALLLLMVSFAVFALLRLTPGDPGALLYGQGATAEDLARLRERWGLDAPLHVQYLRWLANAVAGDLGRSYLDGRPVLAVILERVPATLLLSVTALVLAAAGGVGMGVLAAVRRSSWFDPFARVLATTLYSMPPFWFGILLILFFSVRLGWLPSGGLRSLGTVTGPADLVRHLALPALALAARDLGRLAVVTRSSMLEVMAQEYIRTAAAKGLDGPAIVLRHALRNALLPVLTLLGISVPGLLGGAVVVETVFGWPGMGRLAIESALQRNYPVLMAEVLVVAALALLGSLLADLAYLLADPRISQNSKGIA